MPTLTAADSATPKPDHYRGKKIWGVYVAGATFHVWTHAEVAQLGSYGIQGVLPIVVPSQVYAWWENNHGYAELELLVREAIAWGLPKGSPLCLDVEEHQAAKMLGPSEVARAWAVACRTHDLVPWCYSTASFLEKDLWNNKWLAEWPTVTPANPVPPEGFRAWQYHGNDNGIDHDVFLANEIFLSPQLKVVKVEEGGVVDAASSSSTGSGAGGRAAVSDTAKPAPAPVSKEGHETPSEVNTLDSVADSVPLINVSQPQEKAMNITLSPALVNFVTKLEGFVRKTGSWAVIVNDFTKSFHVTGSYGLNSVLTAIAGSLLYVDHQASKTKTPTA